MKAELAAFAVLAGASAMASPDTEDEFLKTYAETRRFLSGRPVGARPTPDGKAVLFLRAQPKSPEQTLFVFDVATGQTRELLTPEAILKGAAEKLSVAERAMLERKRVTARGFTSYDLSEDGARILVTLSGKLYAVERLTGAVTPLATGEGAVIDPHFSRDGRQVAYVRDNDVFVLDIATNKEHRVTKGGTEGITHGLPEFVAAEEMDRFSGFWWSPDAKFIAYEESDQSHLERFAIADPMHPDREPNAFFYPRAGKDNAKVRLGIVPVAGGATTWAQWDAAKYPYLATVRWPKKGPLTLLVQNRAQTEELLLAVDPKTGKSTELLRESDDAWLNLDQSFPRWLEDGSGFFWATERNGGPEVELRGADGKLVASWVKPDAGFEELAGFDEKTRTLYFAGDPDPTQLHIYRVKEGGAPERFAGASGPGVEMAWLSKDGSVLVVQSQSLTAMLHWSVFKTDGTKAGDLPSVAVEPPGATTAEVKLVGPDKIRAMVIRPRTPHAGKLPVLVDVYGGPGRQVVMQTLSNALLDQWFADKGFLVVRFDGRGTPRRGRAWERSIRGDFSKTVDDQVAALKALGAELPEADLSRVGVSGWSFGGYLSALLVLTHPEVYKAAISGAPVVDWTDYDTHYTERYIGLPAENPKGYEQSSLLFHAPKLSRPLLLVHGTADDNVYFFHTLKLSDALLRAGKKHEVLPLSGFTHISLDPEVTQRLEQRMAQFFKENL